MQDYLLGIQQLTSTAVVVSSDEAQKNHHQEGTHWRIRVHRTGRLVWRSWGTRLSSNQRRYLLDSDSEQLERKEKEHHQHQGSFERHLSSGASKTLALSSQFWGSEACLISGTRHSLGHSS
jgi:hypothetical protein